jgi:hypothetical protein
MNPLTSPAQTELQAHIISDNGELRPARLAQDFGIDRFVAGHAPPINTIGVPSVHKLASMVLLGLGQGHFSRYRPFDYVTKKVSSPVSYVGHQYDRSSGLLQHCFSASQRQTIGCVKWLGAVDVRASYPLWPWTHPHPATGLPGCDDLPMQKGLASIADELNVSLGCYPESTCRRVITVNAMTTWETASGFRLVACDFSRKSLNPDPSLPSHVHRRLTRAYCEEADIRFVHLPPGTFPEHLARQLLTIEPLETREERQRMAESKLYRELVTLLNQEGFGYPVSTLLRWLRARHHVSGDLVQRHFRLCLWNQDTDHDLSAPMQFWRPLIPGGRTLRARMLATIFG